MLEDAIKDIATAEIVQYLKHDDVRATIRRHAISAAEQFIGVLDKAMLATLLQMMDGTDRNSYNSPKVYKTLRKLLNIEDPK